MQSIFQWGQQALCWYHKHNVYDYFMSACLQWSGCHYMIYISCLNSVHNDAKHNQILRKSNSLPLAIKCTEYRKHWRWSSLGTIWTVLWNNYWLTYKYNRSWHYWWESHSTMPYLQTQWNMHPRQQCTTIWLNFEQLMQWGFACSIVSYYYIMDWLLVAFGYMAEYGGKTILVSFQAMIETGSFNK